MNEQRKTKYHIIKEDILKAIQSGELKPGDKIDSESTLKKKYGVSTITVRKAFSDLINEGILYGVQGSGTYVAKKHMIRGLTSISFAKELIQQGYSIDLNIDEIIEITDERIAKKLNIKEDTPIVKIKRVRFANNEPIAYHTSYISSKLLSLQQATTLRHTRSFYETLEQCNIHPSYVHETYSVKYLNDLDICKRMNIPKGTATFYIERIAYSKDNSIIEYSQTYFNSDWYSVTVTINED